MKKIIFISIGVIAIVGVVFFIQRSFQEDKNENLNVPFDEVNKGVLDVEDEAVKSITENISSPVEIAALIKEVGLPFSKEYLAPTEFLNNYNTNYSQAFALGIFSADLGYLNMYNKTGSVIDYLTTIKKLADAINVGQYFDFSTLKRLASNSSNIDSLKYISIHSFNQMDRSLRERKRGNLSALIIAGAWLEGIYVTVQVTKVSADKRLLDKIGEQKIILSDLMLLLKSYAKDPIFKNYLNEFNTIKGKFDEVTITYESGEPESVIEDGMLVIKQNDRSIVNISEDQLNSISKAIEDARNRLVRN